MQVNEDYYVDDDHCRMHLKEEKKEKQWKANPNKRNKTVQNMCHHNLDVDHNNRNIVQIVTMWYYWSTLQYVWLLLKHLGFNALPQLRKAGQRFLISSFSCDASDAVTVRRLLLASVTIFMLVKFPFLQLLQVEAIEMTFEMKGQEQRCFSEQLPGGNVLITSNFHAKQTLLSLIVYQRSSTTNQLLTDAETATNIGMPTSKRSIQNVGAETGGTAAGGKQSGRAKRSATSATDGYEDAVVIFQQREKIQISTAFTTAATADIYTFCVRNDGVSPAFVDVKIAWGPEAKDYSQLAKVHHLDSVTIKLRQMEDMLNLYKTNILFLRERESGMRETNDITAFRILGFSIITIVVLILAGIVQSYYFRNFFRNKKII